MVLVKQIPLKVYPRQSLSVVLEGSLYEISLKECSGIMAVTVVRDGEGIVSNRRAVAGMPVIPSRYLNDGNFILLTDNDELPYYTEFEGSNVLVWVTNEEIDNA